MVRMGKKWEAEHIRWEEEERQREAEMKVREMELLAADKSYSENIETELKKPLATSFRKNEMDMVEFLEKERELMTYRLRPKVPKFMPFTKDVRVVDAKYACPSIKNKLFHACRPLVRAVEVLHQSSTFESTRKYYILYWPHTLTATGYFDVVFLCANQMTVVFIFENIVSYVYKD